ncbi:MAG: ATP-dependent zinc metalloprotease FtsH [Bacteroides sp.]|nr:ATP-dependent zinc metalloprotease FtsH [Bacteroides sp.]MBD5270723.1 ATP-dependent zinc metalloprotease FtsH [Bacteroides sp.]
MSAKSPNNNKSKNYFGLSIYWVYAIIIAFLLGMLWLDDTTSTQDVSYSKFEEYVGTGDVEKITVYTNTNRAEAVVGDSLARVILKDRKIDPAKTSRLYISTDIPSADKMKDQIDAWRAEGVFKGEVNYEKASDYSGIIWTFGPILLLVLFWVFMMKRMSGSAGGSGGPGGVFNVGKSKAKVFEKGEATNVTFKDVAGLTEPKTEIREIVEFLRNPQRYTDLGAKIPKGALLVGPPGTGKTLLAKAVAGEANVPFFSMSGSDFVEMFVGVGASRVRDLFRQAKEKAPCIVFIDEIDAVGRARGKNPNMGANDERENTLNQLLTEMDGFGTNSGVIILAATNRADILDKALLRAGRFDRQINVDLPELKDRIEIFNVHLRNIRKDDSVDVEVMARQTAGFSGADIANVCNEAALIAARNNKTTVDRDSFMAAIDRIIGGLEHSSKVITDEEKRAISIHEAGHATVSWFLKYSSEMVKVSIVPRGQALGAAWYMPEERQITPLQALLDQMCMTLGGRAAEEITLGEVSTGALNDLEKVTKMAYAIVVYYGMSEKIPNVCYYDSTGQSYGFSKPYGGERAKEIDQEVSRIINEQYERAKAIITEHLEGHRRLSETLLKKEVMYSDDLREIFGERPWASRTEEIMRLQAQRDAERQKKAQDSTDQSGSDTTTESSEFTDYTEVTRADDKKESETTPGSESKNAPDDSSPVPPPYKGA